MVNTVISDLFYLFNSFLSYLFGSYISTGVSLGMIFVVVFIFKILLQSLTSAVVIRRSANEGSSRGRNVDLYEYRNSR